LKFFMKKSFLKGSLLALMCAVMLVFSGCSKSKLKFIVDSCNKSCPISLGLAGEITEFTYEDDAVEIIYTMNEQYIDIDKMASNQDNMREAVLNTARNEPVKKLLKMIVDADADICFVYRGNVSGNEARVRLSSKEVKPELDKPELTTEEKLKITLEQTNNLMPIDTGVGIVITELVDKGDKLVYLAHASDKSVLKDVERNVHVVKGNQRIMFKMASSAEKVFFKLVIESGKDLAYLYSADDTDKTVEVLHTNAELKEIFN